MTEHMLGLMPKSDERSWFLVDAAVQRLEDAWQSTPHPDLAQFLPASSEPLRKQTLLELIKVDQELRWQAGEHRRIEEYLHEWPELSGETESVAELLRSECVTRAFLETIPDRLELETRFPTLCQKIDLSSILATAQKELGGAGPGGRSRHLPAADASAVPGSAPPDSQAGTPASLGAPASDTSVTAVHSTQSEGSPAAVMRVSPGSRFGRYDILKEIGRGGMGTVYRAYDTQLGREIALKVPQFDPTTDPAVLARFLREARAAAAIRHPNVCPVYDVGRIEGTYYISMAMVNGRSLAAMLEADAQPPGGVARPVSAKGVDSPRGTNAPRPSPTQGVPPVGRGSSDPAGGCPVVRPASTPMPPAETAEIVRKLARAFDQLHTAGVIHRDVKASNVMIDESGEPLLMDFGLARETSSDKHLTTPGSPFGTPAYMSPEQAAGEAAAADARSDIYSLGVLFYQLLTGRLPFSGSITQVLLSIAQSAPPAPRSIRPELDEALEAICLKAMAKRPADRYQSGGELAAALEEYARPKQQAAGGHTRRPARGRWPRVRVAASALAAAALLAAVQIVRISTDNGDLVIETAGDAEVEVVMQKEAVKIRDIAGKRTYDLKVGRQPIRSGEYRIEVAEESGLRLETEKFTVERSGEVVIKARLEPKLAGATSPSAKPAVGQEGSPPVASVTIPPEPLPALRIGAPLNAFSLVSKPAAIDGVRSWTIETRGHRLVVRAVAYSPDGRRFATISRDSTLHLWETDTGRLVRVLVSPSPLSSVAWSPDGKTLACGTDDNPASVQLWDVQTGRLLRNLRGHSGWIGSVAWSPDGKRLASGSADNTVRLWNVVTGELLDTLQDPKTAVLSLAWSADGKTLAAGTADKLVHLWDTSSGNHLRTLEGHQGEISALAWSLDGQTLATGSGDKTVRLWEAAAGKLVTELKGHEQSIMALTWLPDVKTLASGGADGTGILWDAASGQLQRAFRGTGDPISALAWSPDGKPLTSGNDEGTIRIREVKSGNVVTIPGQRAVHPTWNNSMPPLAWSPDGKILAYGNLDSRLLLWDMVSGLVVRAFQGHVGTIVTVAWSPDSKTVASGGSDNTIRLWDVATGKQLQVLVHGGWTFGLAWSPDGRMLASGGQDNSIKLWEAETGTLLHTLPGHKLPAVRLAWSPDSKTLASGSFDQTVRLWHVETFKHLRTLEKDVSGGSLGEVRGLAWSPDGKILASGSEGLRLWETESGKLLRTMEGGGVRDLAWSADGKTIAAGHVNNLVRIWEADTGKLLRTIEGPSAQIEAVTLSPDGKTLAASCNNYWALQPQIRLWDVQTGRLRALLVPHAHPHGMALSPDGHYRGTPGIEQEIVYVIQTDGGQETLTPAEFGKKYGWKNDPDKLRMGTGQ